MDRLGACEGRCLSLTDWIVRAEKAEAKYEQVTREFDRVCREREKAEAEADDWKQKWEAGRLLISDLEDRLESALEDIKELTVIEKLDVATLEAERLRRWDTRWKSLATEM